MTEEEWLTTTGSRRMVEHVLPARNKRKLRLLGCACARSVWNLLVDERSRSAVIVSERFADETATRFDLEKAIHCSSEAMDQLEDYCTSSLPEEARHSAEKKWYAADIAWKATVGWYDLSEIAYGSEGLGSNVVGIVRDIFGNPFRPVTFNPSWRSSTVLTLAQSTYDEKAFDRLPILADALQDAGCDNDEILNHLRQPGEHCRGCWALDLVLGRD